MKSKIFSEILSEVTPEIESKVEQKTLEIMKPNKENIYLDLSKLSGEEIKEVGQILKDAEEPVYENTAYDLSLGYKDRLYILLSFGVDNWLRYNEIDDKTEISLSEFCQLFSEGEEVLQVENKINIEELTKLCNDYNRSNLKISNLKRDLEYKNTWDEQSLAIQQIKQEISILQKIKETAQSKLQDIGIEF